MTDEQRIEEIRAEYLWYENAAQNAIEFLLDQLDKARAEIERLKTELTKVLMEGRP